LRKKSPFLKLCLLLLSTSAFLNRCALRSFHVCHQTFLVLTFTTVLWKKEILAAISKINYLSMSCLKKFDVSVPPNFFWCYVCRKLKKVENHWSTYSWCLLLKNSKILVEWIKSYLNSNHFLYMINRENWMRWTGITLFYKTDWNSGLKRYNFWFTHQIIWFFVEMAS